MPREKFPSDDIERIMVRFPSGMRDRLKVAADENKRSMNAEIVARLEDSFQASTKEVPFDIKQTTEMSMLTMLNFIELILESDKTGNALSDISRNVRAQFRKDYPDHPLLSKLTDIDGMKERNRNKQRYEEK